MKHCTDCDLYWLDPQPSPETLIKAYENYYTHEPPSLKKPKGIKKLKKQFRLTLLNALCGYTIKGVHQKYAKILSYLPILKTYALKSFGWLEGPHDTGKLLDYGCGNGSFLKQMQELGWDVSGIEFDQKSVDAAQNYFSIPVFIEDSQDAIFPKNSYDAVAMNHVIEHLKDPLKTLQSCHRILCKGGQIVVTTPNANALGHRIFKQAWRGLEFPRHLFVFTPKSIRLLIEKAGFEVSEVRTLSRSARWMWIMSRQAKKKQWPVPHNYKEKNIRTKLTARFFQEIEALFSYFMPLGEELLIIAKKYK
ncbi:MAG: class I SAM-dependent methyltransferase [Nitrospirae bacterium]|nr:class I SAM-dependent methyltransferase [Candidatus Manganitrophaceae bacterium]